MNQPAIEGDAMTDDLSKNKIFQALIKRLERLEKAVFAIGKKPLKNMSEDNFSGPTGGVRFLVSENFFGKKRALSETIHALSGHGYHYSKQAIHQALTYLSNSSGPLVKLKEKGSNFYVGRK